MRDEFTKIWYMLFWHSVKGKLRHLLEKTSICVWYEARGYKNDSRGFKI